MYCSAATTAALISTALLMNHHNYSSSTSSSSASSSHTFSPTRGKRKVTPAGKKKIVQYLHEAKQCPDESTRVEFYRKLLDIQPNHREANHAIANWHEAEGNIARAIHYRRQAIQDLKKCSFEDVAQLGRLLESHNKTQEAIELYRTTYDNKEFREEDRRRQAGKIIALLSKSRRYKALLTFLSDKADTPYPEESIAAVKEAYRMGIQEFNRLKTTGQPRQAYRFYQRHALEKSPSSLESFVDLKTEVTKKHEAMLATLEHELMQLKENFDDTIPCTKLNGLRTKTLATKEKMKSFDFLGPCRIKARRFLGVLNQLQLKNGASKFYLDKNEVSLIMNQLFDGSSQGACFTFFSGALCHTPRALQAYQLARAHYMGEAPGAVELIGFLNYRHNGQESLLSALQSRHLHRSGPEAPLFQRFIAALNTTENSEGLGNAVNEELTAQQSQALRR